MARGDRVEALIDLGNGTSQQFVIEADKNGRTVEVNHLRGGFVEVSVRPARHGKNEPEPVRVCQFLASRVIALDHVRAERAEAKEPSQEAML